MGKLTVPDSPTTYTTHYEGLLGIDCSNPRTEISNRHAAKMVNMLPDDNNGIPVKRKGWRSIADLDSNIVTAFKDQYNDTIYIATENKLYATGGSMRFSNTVTLADNQLTKSTNLIFKLPYFEATADIPSPYLGIENLEISLFGTTINGNTQTHTFTTEELQNKFSFTVNDEVKTTKALTEDVFDFGKMVTTTKSVFTEDPTMDAHMPTGNFTIVDVWVNSETTRTDEEWLVEPYNEHYGRVVERNNSYLYRVVGECIRDGVDRFAYVGQSAYDNETYVVYSNGYIQEEAHAIVFNVGTTLNNNVSDLTRVTLYVNGNQTITLGSTYLSGHFTYYNGYLITNPFLWRSRGVYVWESAMDLQYLKDGDFTDYNVTVNATYRLTSTLRDYNIQGVHHIVPFNGTVYFISDNGIFYRNASDVITQIDPYVPLTVISKNPDGSGGEVLDSVNALTCKQMYNYFADGTASYTFHATNDFVTVLDKVEILVGGIWQDVPNTDYTLNNSSTVTVLDESGTQTTATACEGITFNNAPTANADEASVRITVCEMDTEEASAGVLYGYYRRLAKEIYSSLIVETYGSVNTDRLFIVVGDNDVYYSEAGDITYFPDDNYLTAGNYAPIVGLHKKDSYLVAVTGDSTSHAIFLIQSASTTVTEQSVDSNNDLVSTTYEQRYFSVTPATSGKGAIASNSFATLIDDPLFLGSTGVYSISSHYYSSQTMIVCKSTFINPMLLAENNLENSIACAWKHFYMLFINNHVYVLDANNVTRDMAGNKCYEGYYLEDVPVTRCVLPVGSELYFANGSKWCMFNTDLDDSIAYYDDYVSDTELGNPVICSYTTKLDDDNYPQYFKNLNKKGVVITVQANDLSSVNVYMSKNGEDELLPVKTSEVPTDDLTIDVYTLKKIKKYKRLHFVIENDCAEPFGLIKIVKTWTMGNYAK